MQKFVINTKANPIKLDLILEAKTMCTVRLKVVNPKFPLVVYYDRTFQMQGIEETDIKLPQSSETVELIVMAGQPDNVRVVKLEKSRLMQYPLCYSGKNVREFIDFAQAICNRLPYMPVGDYHSKNDKYQIDLYQVIGGTPTPARIHNVTGIIELSKEKMMRNTVPMNMAILLHEFSHYYLNVELTNEIEADVNALKIYLGLGYPVVESHKAFTDVFTHADNALNRERYDYIFEYVNNFNKLKTKHCI